VSFHRIPRITRRLLPLFHLLLPLLLPLALAGCGEGDVRVPEAPAGLLGQDSVARAPKKSTPEAAAEPPAASADPAAESASSLPQPQGAPVTGEPDVASSAEPEQPEVSPVDGQVSPIGVDSAGDSDYKAGEDPDFARLCGWPVACPIPLPDAVLPSKRIVAYYGNPQSKRMGALGQYPKEEMLRRLQEEVARWTAADPSLPVLPALHLIAVVAQGEPGKAGKYRMIMPDAIVNRVYDWAREVNALLFIDIQTGHDDIRQVLPRFEWILKNPDVHLGIDPEFNLVGNGAIPGTRIGSYDAADINYVTEYLQGLVRQYNLPPKVLTVHRFTRNGVTNARSIALRPEVQIVMHMDGWGAPWLKRATYRDYIVTEPVQYTGFKIFYHNDTKKGDPLLTPEEVLRLRPQPVYIQYQ